MVITLVFKAYLKKNKCSLKRVLRSGKQWAISQPPSSNHWGMVGSLTQDMEKENVYLIFFILASTEYHFKMVNDWRMRLDSLTL